MHLGNLYSWFGLEIPAEAVSVSALSNVIYLFVQDVVIFLIDASVSTVLRSESSTVIDTRCWVHAIGHEGNEALSPCNCSENMHTCATHVTCTIHATVRTTGVVTSSIV